MLPPRWAQLHCWQISKLLCTCRSIAIYSIFVLFFIFCFHSFSPVIFYFLFVVYTRHNANLLRRSICVCNSSKPPINLISSIQYSVFSFHIQFPSAPMRVSKRNFVFCVSVLWQYSPYKNAVITLSILFFIYCGHLFHGLCLLIKLLLSVLAVRKAFERCGRSFLCS